MLGCIIWTVSVLVAIVGGYFLLDRVDNKINFAEKIINMK